MSGVLRPVGPEPVQVYWIRRALALGSVALVLLLAIAVIASLNNSASASGPDAVPAPVGSTSASSPAAASTRPAPSAVATPSFRPAAETATPSMSATPTASASGEVSTSAKSSASSTASASSKASSTELATCDPAQLRPTLTGRQSMKVKSKTNLHLSLINGSDQPCRIAVNPTDFALTIYSGRDRIWSTADCPKLVKTTSVKVAAEDAYEWRVVWDGRRSQKSCKTRPEIPKAGTYIATAQFKGADPVELRMILHK